MQRLVLPQEPSMTNFSVLGFHTFQKERPMSLLKLKKSTLLVSCYSMQYAVVIKRFRVSPLEDVTKKDYKYEFALHKQGQNLKSILDL